MFLLRKLIICRSAEVTDCGRWLIVSPQLECRDNMVYFSKLNPDEEITGKLKLTEIIGSLEADYDYVANVGTRAIFRTNKNAPNYKLISIDLEKFEKDNWSELIAEHPRNVLNWACAVDGDKLAVCYLEDVKVYCNRPYKNNALKIDFEKIICSTECIRSV